MREKPGNLFLLVLAICTLVDVIAARPNEEGVFIISIGVFGALLSRAFLEEPQPLMLCLLGLFLTVYSIVGNHGIVDTLSGGLYLVFLLLAVAYALWEKLLTLTRQFRSKTDFTGNPVNKDFRGPIVLSVGWLSYPLTAFALQVSIGQTKQFVVSVHSYKVIDGPPVVL